MMTTVYSLVSCQVSKSFVGLSLLIKQHLEISWSAGFSHCKVTVFPFVINEYWGEVTETLQYCLISNFPSLLHILGLPLQHPSRLALVAFALGSDFLSLQPHLSNSLCLHLPPPQLPSSAHSSHPAPGIGTPVGFDVQALDPSVDVFLFHLTPLFSSLLPSSLVDSSLVAPSLLNSHILQTPQIISFTICLGRTKPRSWTTLLGCILQDHKLCACPVSRPKKEPGVRNTNGLIHVELTCLKQGSGVTPHHTQQAGHGSFTRRGRGGYQLWGDLSGWLMSYQENQQKSTSLTTPLISYQVETFCSKIRTLISWGGVKYVGRSVRWTQCRCSRHWLSRRHTGSERATILGGLMIGIVVGV